MTTQSAFVDGKIITSAIHKQLLEIYKTVTSRNWETNYLIETTGNRISKPMQMKVGKRE